MQHLGIGDGYQRAAGRGIEQRQRARVELQPGVSVAYHETLLEEVDITLRPDIEHCNHGLTASTRCLGWVGPGGLALLSACNADGVDQLPHLLREDGGWLYPTTAVRIFMATTNARIARDDCLFYIAKE